jgi:hypothetical protein
VRGGASVLVSALIFVIIMLFAFMFFLVLRQPSEEGGRRNDACGYRACHPAGYTGGHSESHDGTPADPTRGADISKGPTRAVS